MSPPSRGLSVAVLGDSSATLYTQDDPKMTSRRDGHLPWGELLPEAAGRPDVTAVCLARVGEELREAVGRQRERLAEIWPDVVVVSHGGREGIVAVPRWLGWLRCYPEAQASDSRLTRLVGRPLWLALLSGLRRHSRLTASVVRWIGIRPVQGSSQLYRQTLEDSVRWMVEELGARVVLVSTFPRRESYWAWFPHVLEANDRTALQVARQWPGHVSVVDLKPELSDADFALDGAHLTTAGHAKAARVVWQHIATTVADQLPSQRQRTNASVA